MITNITNQLNLSGIYKITYDNGKIYIGQATNIRARAWEHNSKSKYPCDKALKLHSATIEILEEIKDFSELEIRENYWINHFNATNKEIGYNILTEGNASGKRGTKNCNASFTQKQLDEIVDLLINHTELSYIEIANKFNVVQDTIYRISKGLTYHNPKLTYPLRDNNHDFARNDYSDYFNSLEELIALKEDLLYRWDLNIDTDLCQKYKIPLKIIRDINQGRKFQEYGEYSYPIREFNRTRNTKKLKQQDILFILEQLKDTNLSMTKIGEPYGLHRSSIARINKGETYPIKNYIYPAR